MPSVKEGEIERYSKELPVSPEVERPKAHPLRYAVEFALALALSLLLSPVWLLLGLILKLQGQGSVIFYQERVGLNEKHFNIIKFRTMKVNAEQQGPMVCTSYHDERITKIGKALRKSKLDETLQLINIMKGDMSFVGPRPERPYYHQQYLETIDHWQRRTRVKPGISGLAQISAIITHEPRLKILADIVYINNRTLIFDIYLVILTVLPERLLPKAIKGVPIRR